MVVRLARSVLACSLLAVSFAAGGVFWVPSGASGIAGPALDQPATQPTVIAQPLPRPNIATGPEALELLSRTSWVGPGPGQFQLHLKVTSTSPGSQELEVIVYSRLTARSQFQVALGGDVSGVIYDDVVPLSKLVNDPRGGVDVDIPVNQPTGSSAYDNLPIPSTGVYPVQAFLEEAGVRKGQPLTTFIVYAGNDASTLQRLDVSLVVPVAAKVDISPAGSIEPLPSEAAVPIVADAAALAGWHVPVTVGVNVPTLEALAAGTTPERAAVANLRSALSSGDELLPSTEFPVDVAELVSSGLTSDVASELASGGAILDGLLGVTPLLSTWAFAGDVSSTSMSALAGLGAAEVAVPESDLSDLPVSDQKLTFAQPTKLSLSWTDIEVVGADSELSERISEAAARGEAVLVADQVLAELAMIDLEAPSELRGVVLLPPPHTTVSPVFLSVLLAGLRDNPLLRPVPLQQLFKDVPLAPSGTSRHLVRELEAPQLTTPLGGADQLQQALAEVAAVGEVYGGQSTLVSGLNQGLVVSLSSVFSGSQRASMIAGVLQAAKGDLRKVHLPPSISITLTSGQGRLPLTLVSTAGLPIKVLLVLTSVQLRFVKAHFAEGDCLPVNAGSEDCLLTLDRPTTPLQIPVVVRTPGAFPLLLQVETPSGEILATSTDTVRSTAIGDVAVVLMVGAALFLAVWWVRNARHGRRARRLVPRPPDDEPGDAAHRPGGPLAVAPSAGVPSGGSRVER